MCNRNRIGGMHDRVGADDARCTGSENLLVGTFGKYGMYHNAGGRAKIHTFEMSECFDDGAA